LRIDNGEIDFLLISFSIVVRGNGDITGDEGVKRGEDDVC
jgi:hypothetical protein